MLYNTLTPLRSGFFFGLLGPDCAPPPLNSQNIIAVTTKLREHIVRLQTFPLKFATSADDLI